MGVVSTVQGSRWMRGKIAVASVMLLFALGNWQAVRSQPAPNGASPFPMAEKYCASPYGSSAPQSVPYCPMRVAQCYQWERDARKRLEPRWNTLSKSIRKSCVADAEAQFATVSARHPAVKAMINASCYYGGYSIAAVELCVAGRLPEPLPVPPPGLPAACMVSGSATPPTGEAASAEAQRAGFDFNQPEAKWQCVARERQAKKRLETLWPRLPRSVVDGCAKRITQEGFDGAVQYRSSAFLSCAQAATSDWGTGR